MCSEVTSPSSITPALRVGEGVTVEFKLAVLKQCVHVWCVECVHVWCVECVHVWCVHVWCVECVHVWCVHVWCVECVHVHAVTI